MSATTNLLSRRNNIQQLTINIATREKFISSGLIQGAPDSNGFDQLHLPAGQNLRLTNPNCVFKQIPNKVDSVAFLEYLGVKREVAGRIFGDASGRTHGMIDGEALYNQVKLYAQQLITTLDNQSFTTDLISDVNRQIHIGNQVPATMDSYRATYANNKPFKDLTNLDYLYKIFLARIANLICLDRAINEYMQS